ncbi:ATP-binding protein, partial [Streptomyces sp. NPDC058953]|uniref:ATP-binding protein n=1 Tax=Streptomyces sp. NPDC058953 TaxID=3346676 RepID=UPI00369FDC99
LRAVVDWSWDLLDHAERTVLRRLSVFAGGCDLPEAEAVCGRDATGTGGTGGPDVLAALAALVDKSLVVAAPGDQDGAGMRYRLLETVAEYAAERLDAAGERGATERRHLRAYRELARVGEPGLRGGEGAAGLARFDTELGNFRAALRTAVDHREEQEGLCLVLALGWYWQLRSHAGDARVWAAAVAGLGPDPFADPVRPAEPMPARCTATPPPWSDPVRWEARRGVHLTALAAGGADGMAVNRPEAADRLRRIVAAYRPGLPQLSRQPAAMWYFCRLITGGYPGLDETADAIVGECEEHHARGVVDDWDLAFVLLTRARLRGHDPRTPGPTASPLAPRPGGDADLALALFESTGDDWGFAVSYAARGEHHEWYGRYEEAAVDYTEALRVFALNGSPTQTAVYQARLVFLRLRTATDDAEREAAERELLRAARESGRGAGEADYLGVPHMLLARHYGGTGRTGLARAELDAMDRELSTEASGLFRGVIAGMRAWLDCLDGEYGRARARVRGAIRRFDGLGHFATRQTVDQFLCAAWAMAHLGDAADAARLLAVYDASGRHPDGGGAGFQPFHDEDRTRRAAGDAALAALGDCGWRRAYREGAGLEIPDAVGLI